MGLFPSFNCCENCFERLRSAFRVISFLCDPPCDWGSPAASPHSAVCDPFKSGHFTLWSELPSGFLSLGINSSILTLCFLQGCNLAYVPLIFSLFGTLSAGPPSPNLLLLFWSLLVSQKAHARSHLGVKFPFLSAGTLLDIHSLGFLFFFVISAQMSPWWRGLLSSLCKIANSTSALSLHFSLNHFTSKSFYWLGFIYGCKSWSLPLEYNLHKRKTVYSEKLMQVLAHSTCLIRMNEL